MKIVSAVQIGNRRVYDLRVDHPDHSFVLGAGIVAHNCGFVIANRPIHEFIPTTVISDTVCTAYTPASVEAVGGVKMDFLVINSLNDISAAISMAQERSGLQIPEKGIFLNGKWVPRVRLVPLKSAITKWKKAREESLTLIMNPEDNFADIWDLPQDQKVFAAVSNGRTETVFQFNTPGATQWLRNFREKKSDGNYGIDSVSAMAAFTALDRPGPLDAMVTKPGCKPIEHTPSTNDFDPSGTDHPLEKISNKDGGKQKEPEGGHNMLVEYARRVYGMEPSQDIFPFFDDLFPETRGVMVYQEQLQFAYQYLTGCTGAEAEEFRRNIAKKKMEKVLGAYPNFIEKASHKLGSKEDAEKCWEFFKTWGQYGFNKSHAICYSIIGYSCAYMKLHFPLEWWTAVLRNATKEEINEKFWKYCGNLINLPDVTASRPQFEIVDERIQAPLSLLHGVGEKAHQQLVAGAPYTDINDFVARIQAFRDAGATYYKAIEKKTKKDKKTGTEVVTEKEVTKKKQGPNALNRGIIYTLIISGAMDSLFPPGAPVLEMLGLFEDAMHENGCKRDNLRLEKYSNLDQGTRYQMRKSILPAYSADLLPLFGKKCADIVFDGKRFLYRWKSLVPLANALDLDRINMISPFPDDPLVVAVMGYVETQRVFNWGNEKQKEAVEIVLDIDGVRRKFVKWPPKNSDKLKPQYKQALTGAIVVLTLTKFKEGKDMSVEELTVVQPALENNLEASS